MSDYASSAAAHQMHDGFANICYLAGWLRYPRQNFFFIQQTDDETKMIPVELADGVRLPPKFKSGEKVKILARLSGRSVQLFNGETVQSCVMRVTNARSITEANLLDMPARDDYYKVVDGPGASLLMPPEFGSVLARERLSNFSDDEAINNLIMATPDGTPVWKPSIYSGFEPDARSGNEVTLAGLLVKLVPGKKRGDGVPETATAIIRTTANPAEDIAVLIYGKYVGKLIVSIRVGMTVVIEKGQIRMHSHVEKNPDGTAVVNAVGKQRSKRTAVIIAGSKNVRDAKPKMHFLLPLPQWLLEFRDQRREAALASAARSSQVAAGTGTPQVVEAAIPA